MRGFSSLIEGQIEISENSLLYNIVQRNLDLVTLNLVTTCDLVTIFQRRFFNLLHKIIRFSALMIKRFSDSLQRPKVSLNLDSTVCLFSCNKFVKISDYVLQTRKISTFLPVTVNIKRLGSVAI